LLSVVYICNCFTDYHQLIHEPTVDAGNIKGKINLLSLVLSCERMIHCFLLHHDSKFLIT